MEKDFAIVQLSRVDLINLVYAINVCLSEHEKLTEDESQEMNLRLAKLQESELQNLREKFDNYACELTLSKSKEKLK